MKKILIAMLFLAISSSAFADKLPKQTLTLINGCSGEPAQCMTMSDEGGDGLSLIGDRILLEKLAVHIGQDVTVEGEPGEGTFKVTKFTID